MRKQLIKTTTATLLVTCAIATFAQSGTTSKKMAEVRAMHPQLAGLDDDQVVDALREAFYQDLPRERVAASLGVVPRAPKPALGPIDKWRYESCQESAIKSPTAQGVNNGLRLCRERFNQ